MATVIEADEGVSVGRVFTRGIGVIADNPLTVLGIAFLFGAIPSVVLGWAQRSLLFGTMDRYQTIGSFGISLVSMLISLTIQGLVQGALVRATLAYVRGERATLGECISASLTVVLPLVGLSVLMFLAVEIGLVLFIVPGVMLYVMWAVASPALVAERTGIFAAFGRSRYLTKGARWKVFGVEAIIIIAYFLFAAAFGALVYATVGFSMSSVAAVAETGALPLGWLLTTVISSTVVSMAWSTVQSSLYVELRNWKEGLPEQALEDIFS